MDVVSAVEEEEVEALLPINTRALLYFFILPLWKNCDGNFSSNFFSTSFRLLFRNPLFSNGFGYYPKNSQQFSGSTYEAQLLSYLGSTKFEPCFSYNHPSLSQFTLHK